MGTNSCAWVVIAIVTVVAILAITLISISLNKLNSTEVGLKYDTIWKKLSDKASEEGLHAGTPGFEFIKFPAVFRTLTFANIKCLNKNGVTIDLHVGYQYRARQSKLYELVTEFTDHNGYETVLFTAGESAILDACSTYNLTQFQSQRGLFSEVVRQRVVEKYDPLYADITDLQVNNIQRPSRFEQAIEDKEKARSDIAVIRNERPRLVTQAITVRREAETQANITLAKAQSDARITVNRAEAESEAIYERYVKEAEAYEKVIDSSGLAFSTKAFISYISVRTISSSTNDVYVGMKGPAKTSYVDES